MKKLSKAENYKRFFVISKQLVCKKLNLQRVSLKENVLYMREKGFASCWDGRRPIKVNHCFSVIIRID